MTPARFALLIAVALIALAPLAVQAAQPAAAAPGPASTKVTAKDPAARPLAVARRLSAHWGRCPSSRPAYRLLTIASRTKRVRPRVLRARAALRAWRGVVADCRKPVAMPSIIVIDGS